MAPKVMRSHVGKWPYLDRLLLPNRDASFSPDMSMSNSSCGTLDQGPMCQLDLHSDSAVVTRICWPRDVWISPPPICLIVLARW
jgi:hypothetical protein